MHRKTDAQPCGAFQQGQGQPGKRNQKQQPGQDTTETRLVLCGRVRLVTDSKQAQYNRSSKRYRPVTPKNFGKGQPVVGRRQTVDVVKQGTACRGREAEQEAGPYNLSDDSYVSPGPAHRFSTGHPEPCPPSRFFSFTAWVVACHHACGWMFQGAGNRNVFQ